MTPIQITLQDLDTLTRRDEPWAAGVPLPAGEIRPETPLQLVETTSAALLPLQTEPTAFWPDGSIRWLLVRSLCDLEANSAKQVMLGPASEPEPAEDALVATHQAGEWTVVAGSVTHCIRRKPFRLESRIGKTDSPSWYTFLRLLDSQEHACEAVVDDVTVHQTRSRVALTVTVDGHWLDAQGKQLARYECVFHFVGKAGHVELELAIHNPNRALHPGGLWDLGDEGSIYFRDLCVCVEGGSRHSARLLPSPDGETLATDSDQEVSLYQDSSGGRHWDSRNHIDKAGNPTTRFRGYRITQGEQTMAGSRAQPILETGTDKGVCSAALSQFWQNFPSALRSTQFNQKKAYKSKSKKIQTD